MEIQLQKFRISLVLNSFFFPLTSKEVFDSLTARSFDVGRTLPSQVPTGPRIYVSGPIARKGTTIVDVEDSRNLVGVSGSSAEKALEVFSEILAMLSDDFNVNLGRELDYVELIAHYLVKSEKNPFDVVQNCVETKFRDKFKQILNVETSDYRFSIAPKGVLPSSRKWFEFSISPKLTMPTKAYWLEVIFRDVSSDEVTSFARTLNSKVADIITAIESS